MFLIEMVVILVERNRLTIKGAKNRRMVMKNIFLIVSLFLGMNGICQDAPVLQKFTVEELNGKAYLNWTIEAGGTCNGIGILRSSDTISFSQIGVLEGVCGSLSFPTNYTFTDEFPMENKINYYKLDLGGNGFSQIVGVEVIVIGEEKYLLFSNPIVEKSTLYFKNETNQLAELKVFDPEGGICLVKSTTTDQFELIRSEFSRKGIYLFTISVDGIENAVVGKLIVQ
jgi:hypothetical protein